MSNPLSRFTARTLEGEDKPLGDFAGKVLLVVNTASQCGFTPQYEGLESLYQRYRDRGFEILGFPCNQFGKQEPGSEEEIKQFCSLRYNVTFPMFAKVEVNGANTHPFYAWLKREAPGLLGSELIKWNFTKFLIGRDGTTVQRFAPKTEPQALAEKIEALL